MPGTVLGAEGGPVSDFGTHSLVEGQACMQVL